MVTSGCKALVVGQYFYQASYVFVDFANNFDSDGSREDYVGDSSMVFDMETHGNMDVKTLQLSCINTGNIA